MCASVGQNKYFSCAHEKDTSDTLATDRPQIRSSTVVPGTLTSIICSSTWLPLLTINLCVPGYNERTPCLLTTLNVSQEGENETIFVSPAGMVTRAKSTSARLGNGWSTLPMSYATWYSCTASSPVIIPMFFTPQW